MTTEGPMYTAQISLNELLNLGAKFEGNRK